MFHLSLRLVSAVAVCVLASCGGNAAINTDPGDGGGDGDGGGGGGSVDPPPIPTALYVASPTEQTHYEDTFRPALMATGPASVMGGVTTFVSDLPSTGSMDYAGYLELVIASGTASANVAGDATMTLTLSNLSIAGTARNFMGSAIDENLEERLVNYAGEMVISNGQITPGAAGEALVTLDIDGTLESGLHAFGVDGTLVGGLYGSGGEGLRARASSSGLDGSMVTTVDGAPGVVGVGTLSALLATP